MKVLMLMAALLVPGVAWAVGWVLIWPKIDIKDGRPISRIFDPVANWEQVYAFDSATVCEQVRKNMIDQAKRDSKGDNSDFNWVGANASRCMPYVLWWQSQQPRTPCEK